jgi:hypothetical protein
MPGPVREKVYSPLIPLGSADVIVSFELLESLRKIEYLAPEGKIPRQSGKNRAGPGRDGQHEVSGGHRRMAE